ncbi:ATP-grasp domain protein [Planctomycetes bacterium MalM25]|nr:ATP-grasp domain protein [Planctomycetes bacterium MalM25]
MTRLAIVGASVRAAAQSALRAGFEVVGADLFADADLDGVCPIAKVDDYPDGLVDWLAAQEIDAWMYTGALENYPELVDRMAAIAPLWGVSGAALRRCRDPLALQEVCREAGVAFPETLPPGDTPASPDGWLAKTYCHSNGAGVCRLEENEHAGAYAQRLVEGESLAAIYALTETRPRLLGLTRQLLGEGWGYRGSIGPVQPTAKPSEQLTRLGWLLHEALGLRGLVGVDLIDHAGVLHLIEINPRYTASVEVLERAAGRSALSCLDEATAGPWSFGQTLHGKRVVYAKEPLTITPELDAWMAEEQATGRLADRPRLGEVISAGAPVCTWFAKGSDYETASDLLSHTAMGAGR